MGERRLLDGPKIILTEEQLEELPGILETVTDALDQNQNLGLAMRLNELGTKCCIQTLDMLDQRNAKDADRLREAVDTAVAVSLIAPIIQKLIG